MFILLYFNSFHFYILFYPYYFPLLSQLVEYRESGSNIINSHVVMMLIQFVVSVISDPIKLLDKFLHAGKTVPQVIHHLY